MSILFLIKIRSCVATMSIIHHADKCATPPPTDRASERNKKTRDNLSIISRELREEDSNLRPPGYEPGKLTNCSTPRCIFTLKRSSLVLRVQRYGKKLKLPNLLLKYFNNCAYLPSSDLYLLPQNAIVRHPRIAYRRVVFGVCYRLKMSNLRSRGLRRSSSSPSKINKPSTIHNNQ